VFFRFRFPIVAFWTIIATLVVADNALAYVGPGAGMEFITYAISLLAMVGLAFFSILMWPFYTLLRWLRGTKAVTAPNAELSSTSAQTVDATSQTPPTAPAADGGKAS